MISIKYLFELVSYTDDVNDVYDIESKFTDQEKKMTGGRSFYDPSEFRRILKEDDKPVAYLEARIHHNIAKINIGVHPKFRRKNYMEKLLKQSIKELKQIGVNKIIAMVHEDNIKSNNFFIKFDFIRITNKNKLKSFRFYEKNHNYYELNLKKV